MSFWKWSRTAGTNATADGSINWAEGMAPSAVNDSARAMMAAAAKYRDDIAGAITTGGTSTAYTVTSYQSFDTLAHLDGAMIAFTPHTTSAGSAGSQITLNVDSLGAKPIRLAPSVEIPSGTLVQGTPYVVTYNNSDAAFYLRGPGLSNPYQIPLGGMLPYTGSTAPNSAFVLPYGQAISRTTYATYFSLVSTTYGVGDGSTTFNVIDLRGRLPIGKDDMGGSAANRVTTAGSSIDGTTIGATGGAQNIAILQGNLPAVSPTFTGNAVTPTFTGNTVTPAGSVSINDPGHSHNTVGLSGNAYAFDHGSQQSTGVSGSGSVNGTAHDLNTNGTSTNTTGITASFTGNSLTPAGTISSITPAGSISALGSGTALNKMPPGIVVPYILRVI